MSTKRELDQKERWKMSEPCMCGAEDCAKCYPRDERKPVEIYGLHIYQQEIDADKRADYICQGYYEPREIRKARRP